MLFNHTLNPSHSHIFHSTENGENVTGAFTVNPVSGVLLTTVHVDSGARTPSSYFDVVVVAADQGTPPKTAEGKIRVIIDVTQTVSKLIKTARFVSQFVAKVAEDASVGDVVKNFTGAFPGAEKTEYQVTGKWNDTFEFDGLNLKLMKKLDYEDTRIHFVDIRYCSCFWCYRVFSTMIEVITSR